MEPGETVFTSSGTFIVPKGVKEIEVFCVGGGGSGNHRAFSGSGGGYTKTEKLSVNPGDEINIAVGSGSAKTIVDEIYADYGGAGSETYDEWFGRIGYGANGGSGGGARGYSSEANGGSDGGDGGTTRDFVVNKQTTCVVSGGEGQGTTTRAFGESEGTLYSGGGGAGSSGIGGAGGGGNAGCDGAINTGGGAGSARFGGKNGGSGIAIIRWGY